MYRLSSCCIGFLQVSVWGASSVILVSLKHGSCTFSSSFGFRPLASCLVLNCWLPDTAWSLSSAVLSHSEIHGQYFYPNSVARVVWVIVIYLTTKWQALSTPVWNTPTTSKRPTFGETLFETKEGCHSQPVTIYLNTSVLCLHLTFICRCWGLETERSDFSLRSTC